MEPLILSIIFVGAILIGIFAVVMGGTLFMSLPLFQVLFPEMSLGAIIGNVKIGSVFRNTAALIPLYKNIDMQVLWLAPVLCLGSVIGSWQIVHVSALVVPVVLIIGFLVHEYSRKLRVSTKLFWPIAFFVGFYGGIFGAGIMLLLLTLMQLRNIAILDARTNALLLELLLSLVAVVTFWYFDLIHWPIAITWAGGGIIGGYLGGIIISCTGRWPEQTQYWLIRIAFLIALLVALWQL